MTYSGERPTPQATSHLLGHEKAERVFLDAWNAGRLHHAWLLTGARGIGKATLAYRIARFVLAQDGEGAAGLFGDAVPIAESLAISPEHPAARKVAAAGHPDLLVLERSVNSRTGKLRTEISVDDVRRLAPFLSLTSAGGGWRVVIVDVADDLNRSAANALLKSLEEPPPQTLFLLVSHLPGRLLPTIRSRCRVLNLSPLSEAVVVELLERLGPEMAPGNLQALARLSDGSIGQALALADTGGLDLYRELLRLLSQGDGLDIKAVHALGGKLGRAGAEEAFEMLGRLIDRWISGMILGHARGAMAPDVVEGEGEAARALFVRAGLARWLEVWEKVTRLFSQAGGANLDRRQVVISAFLAMQAAARG